MNTPDRHDQINRLNRSLTNQSPNETQIAAIEEIREVGRKLAEAIVWESNPSREQSLALTKLEETVMWAVKGVVLNGEPTG